MRIPRNEMACTDRKCGINCHHCFRGHCVVPINDQFERREIVMGSNCSHTDESYEAGMAILDQISPKSRLSTDDRIRLRYGIPSDVPITQIDRLNFRNDCQAELYAIFNSRAPAVMF